MFILVDCNSFFVSCERLFRPELCGKPVVVLSGDNGCVVACSNEAKSLGFIIGDPFFQYKDKIEVQSVVVLFSNLSLYADMSKRVMETLKKFSLEMEIYSIDEAFLKVSMEGSYVKFGETICKTVLHWTGIPVSVGIAKTKTLAKIASKLAKKMPSSKGVMFLETEGEINAILANLDPINIWGVGVKKTEILRRHQIFTAKDLKDASDGQIQKAASITGLRTALELRGISCFNLTKKRDKKKSIISSGSFLTPLSDVFLIKQALSFHIFKAAHTLRGEQLHASLLTVFLERHPYVEKERNVFEVQIALPFPSAYTPLLLKEAKKALEILCEKHVFYRKVGVCLENFVCFDKALDFFSEESAAELLKKEKIMQLMDSLNKSSGKELLFLASLGNKKNWQTHRKKSSPSYTTDVNALLTIKVAKKSH
jgi:DNA polymerase V